MSENSLYGLLVDLLNEYDKSLGRELNSDGGDLISAAELQIKQLIKVKVKELPKENYGEYGNTVVSRERERFTKLIDNI